MHAISRLTDYLREKIDRHRLHVASFNTTSASSNDAGAAGGPVKVTVRDYIDAFLLEMQKRPPTDGKQSHSFTGMLLPGCLQVT